MPRSRPTHAPSRSGSTWDRSETEQWGTGRRKCGGGVRLSPPSVAAPALAAPRSNILVSTSSSRSPRHRTSSAPSPFERPSARRRALQPFGDAPGGSATRHQVLDRPAPALGRDATLEVLPQAVAQQVTQPLLEPVPAPLDEPAMPLEVISVRLERVDDLRNASALGRDGHEYGGTPVGRGGS